MAIWRAAAICFAFDIYRSWSCADCPPPAGADRRDASSPSFNVAAACFTFPLRRRIFACSAVSYRQSGAPSRAAYSSDLRLARSGRVPTSLEMLLVLVLRVRPGLRGFRRRVAWLAELFPEPQPEKCLVTRRPPFLASLGVVVATANGLASPRAASGDCRI